MADEGDSYRRMTSGYPFIEFFQLCRVFCGS